MPDHRSATMAANLPSAAYPHAAFPLSDGPVPLLVRRRGVEKGVLHPGRHGACPSLPPPPPLATCPQTHEIAWPAVLTRFARSHTGDPNCEARPAALGPGDAPRHPDPPAAGKNRETIAYEPTPG